MSTNYYLRPPGACPTECSNWIHLGKSSAGWSFTFAARLDAEPLVTDYPSWLTQLAEDAEIYDEYSRPVARADLLALVENKRGGRNVLAGPDFDYLDADGYRFIRGWFS